VETFTEPKKLTDFRGFQKQRREHLARLKLDTIEVPIVEIIRGFAKLPYCFTLQSCYGHFVHGSQEDAQNTEPLPAMDGTALVEYRIAYIALCIENNALGRALLADLRDIQSIDPEYVQFGSAGWFWERQPNTYALQVEPRRHMDKDRVVVGYEEAVHIESVRGRFFAHLERLLRVRLPRDGIS